MFLYITNGDISLVSWIIIVLFVLGAVGLIVWSLVGAWLHRKDAQINKIKWGKNIKPVDEHMDVNLRPNYRHTVEDEMLGW